MSRFLPMVLILLCAVTPARPASGAPEVPVLFVHGSGLDSSTWETMQSALRAAGYPRDWLHAIDMRPPDGDNVRSAEKFIAPAVEVLLNAARQRADHPPVTRVDIVAHSMGAVSARWFAARMHPEKVRTLITLAGANHGTDALCGATGSGDRQMCPAFGGDSVQRDLNGTPDAPLDETPYGLGADPSHVPRIEPDAARGILYLTLRIEPDRWIVPARSALLTGAGGAGSAHTHRYFRETSPGNWLFLGGVDHDTLPMDGAVIDWVARVLMQ